MGEVHLHGEDTNILRACLRGVDGGTIGVGAVGSGTVGVDAVDSGHICREMEGETRRGLWVGGGRGLRRRRKTGDEVL